LRCAPPPAEVIERGKRFAAHFMDADTADIAFDDGAFTIAGTDRSMPIGKAAQMSFIPMGLPSELGVGLQGAGAFSSDGPSFPNGCHLRARNRPRHRRSRPRPLHSR
jgi:aerobic carbon-monoxide dehydrogenase large subunit